MIKMNPRTPAVLVTASEVIDRSSVDDAGRALAKSHLDAFFVAIGP